MKNIEVNFSERTGTIKPLHGTNNGPWASHPYGLNYQSAFVDAGIPYARVHDSSFSSLYGGEYATDVENIFRNFDADENDPKSYDFLLTDLYCQALNDSGCKILYRLGSKIEHTKKKYHTHPPKDFAKWARVCEHIIRHLCYGWADGLYLDIPYLEVWNEPECYQGDGSNPCWQGTMEQFYAFYEVVAKHLKKCFPELKVGGPAFTVSKPERPEMEEFVSYAEKHHVPLDFYSWHGYKTNPNAYARSAEYSRRLLDSHGFTHTELIIDEWNYVKGWMLDDIKDSYHANSNQIGAAFNAATMLCAQKSSIDLMTYYDARPRCAFNGLFTPYTYEIQKPYYAFWQFNQLYRLGTEVFSESGDSHVYVGAAVKDNAAAVQIVYYAEEALAEETIAIHLNGMVGTTEVTCLLVDEAHDNEPIRKEVFTTPSGTLFINLKQYSTVLLQMKQL